MKIFIPLLIAAILAIYYWIYRLFMQTAEDYLGPSLRKEVNKINKSRNYWIKIRVTPGLLILLVLQPIVIFEFISDDFYLLNIIDNPIVAYATITKIEDTTTEDHTHFSVKYTFEISNGNSVNPYTGQGEVDEKIINSSKKGLPLLVTYNKDNPQTSKIGDYTGLSLMKLIKRRAIPYLGLAVMYLSTMFGAYYIIFRLKTKIS